MELHQVKYFLAVAETLNFTRAAERCHVTQPALTRAIQKLEEEFGGQLFRRERKRTHLTDLGELLHPQLAEVSRRSEEARNAARGFLQLKEAPLKLGVMCTIGPLRFVAFLRRFSAIHAGIEVSLMEAVPEQLSRLLMAGEIDLAVMTAPQEMPARMNLRPLYEERFVVAFPPGHRFQELQEVPLAMVAGESYLSRTNCEYFGYLDGLLSERMIDVADAYRSEREDWIQSMIMAGMGIAFLPEFTPVLKGLPTRPIAEPSVTRIVQLATVAGRRFSPAVAAFVKALERHDWKPAMMPDAVASKPSRQERRDQSAQDRDQA